MDGRGTWHYLCKHRQLGHGAWSMEQGALPGSELRLWLWRWPLLEGGLASGSAEFAPKH